MTMGDRTKGMKITVGKDGPYTVQGGVPLMRAEIVVDADGEAIDWSYTEPEHPGETYTLCRCGKSGYKPYCDGSHADGFDGTETDSKTAYFERAACVSSGTELDLRDAAELCAEARYCHRAGGLWNLVKDDADPSVRAIVEREAELCPSGRYTVCDAGTTNAHEPEFEPSIALIEDPALGVSGPIWVRGGIPIFAADGEPYEVRNRVTLCRCGESKNKPFCDGSHIEAGFKAEYDD